MFTSKVCSVQETANFYIGVKQNVLNQNRFLLAMQKLGLSFPEHLLQDAPVFYTAFKLKAVS